MNLKTLLTATALTLAGLAMAATPNLDKREANRDSRAIHRKKHNERTAATPATTP